MVEKRVRKKKKTTTEDGKYRSFGNKKKVVKKKKPENALNCSAGKGGTFGPGPKAKN